MIAALLIAWAFGVLFGIWLVGGARDDACTLRHIRTENPESLNRLGRMIQRITERRAEGVIR